MRKSPKEFFIESNCYQQDLIPGGLADNKTIQDIAMHHSGGSRGRTYTMLFYIIKSQLEKGTLVELEHTDSRKKAMEIALDHLMENPYYYEDLEKIEKV